MKREPSQESIQVNPNDIGVKPVTTPKGTIPGKNGSIARIPFMKGDLSRLDCCEFMLGRYSKLKKKTQEIGKGLLNMVPIAAVDNYGDLFFVTALNI